MSRSPEEVTIELIYSVRRLAEVIETESHQREKEFEQLHEVVSANRDALMTMPGDISDKLSSAIDRTLANGFAGTDRVLGEIKRNLESMAAELQAIDVRAQVEQGQLVNGKRSESHGDGIIAALRRDGRISLNFNWSWLVRAVQRTGRILGWTAVIIGAGGGLAWVSKILHDLIKK